MLNAEGKGDDASIVLGYAGSECQVFPFKTFRKLTAHY